MGHAFEESAEAELDGVTPEQVWDAIATGPGIDSWFMGRNEVEPGAAVRQAFGEYRPEHPVTAWEPGRRLAFGGEKAPDGRFVAYEYLIEGRAGGSTVVRMVTSGFLPGDDWEEEFEAMLAGGAMFWHTLVTYLRHYAGRTARPVTAFGPPITDWPATWTRLGHRLGLYRAPRTGDEVTLDGTPGVVYHANSQTAGIRTADAVYRFFQGMGGTLTAMHHVFTDDGRDERAWIAWMADLA
ncbi:SRPBCC family protein [Saccharothrix syringae]|uniref:SRPBCC domain-containing protein n=1 Tax=Saccharothrix syringae TaxID=103733 RepID=A0A5Q0GRL5_SACSY|nr:SRPBCC domain-containing protein [Saccharothrix syringae]QFZ16563.1 SRPBCC domain-containing protein [Saccharothrix syringae]